MKLKEWLAFNKPFMACDFTVMLLKDKSYRGDDVLIETKASWEVCERLFGEYEIAKLTMGHYPNSEDRCFKLLLWDTTWPKQKTIGRQSYND